MNWRIVWSEHARRDLRRLDALAAERVVRAVERLAEAGHGDVRRLQGIEGQWRLRVGKWRVRFTLDPTSATLLIIHVLPRESAYRN
ncbi:MAG: type II toxin-antitoxin system RelE/ParE family toxin [Chloroflexota bacterium]|nr:type II toxin-antitoxin system RelE/ParE family toxin [Chloroflexota bacterium]MDE2840269.1 type II toxin-antitoxin system RelE/ParE family toxin [Chloroflexota bacterium]MDE2929377.1 type II toxin-antitoxin system RelE/ParE family toxin [Chloroflexota bacterium]